MTTPKKQPLRLSQVIQPTRKAETPPPIVAPVVADTPPARPAKPKPADTAKQGPMRENRQQVSLYLPFAVHSQLNRLVLELTERSGQKVKVHDLLLEGVDMVLAKYGKPSIADLTDGE